MSALEHHVSTVVAHVLGYRDPVQPDTPFIIGQNCSMRDLRKIAYRLSFDFGLADFSRTHWENWMCPADIILDLEKAQQAKFNGKSLEQAA